MKFHPWVLRWDTLEEAKPKMLGPTGSEVSSFYAETKSGGFAVFDGYLFEQAGLRVGTSPPAPVLVASAYDRWQDDFLEKLRGGFTLAVWDPQRQRLMVGRDAMGLNPCFYCWNERLLLVSPALDEILAQPEVEGRFSRLAIAEYVQDTLSSHHSQETFYEGVRRLLPAHALSVSGRKLTLSRYWDPLPPGFNWTSEEELAQLEPTLERAVARCLDVGADSIALSGGFDSVSLAVLAAEQLHGKPPLHAVSLRFSDPLCDEGETQVAVSRALGMPQLIQTVEESLGGCSIVNAALALSESSPSPVLSPWQSMYTGLLGSAGALGLTRLLMGTGGDDMFAVSLNYGADRLAALDLPGLWRFYRALRRASPFSATRVARVVLWDGAASPELRRLARTVAEGVSPKTAEWLRRRRRRRSLAPWAVPADRELREELEHRSLNPLPVELAPGERSYVQSIRWLTQAPMLQIQQDQSHAWARRLGFTLLFPYFDREVVELSLQTHPEHLIVGGWAKAPLRRLVAQRLPSVHLRTKKVDFTRTADEVLRSGGQHAWQALGGPKMLDHLGIADSYRLTTLVDDYFEARNDEWWQAWLVLSTEAWLRARCG